MNQVILFGRLVRDALVYEGVVKFTIATKIGYDKEQEKEKVAFVPVTVFGLSENQVPYLVKGKQVLVEGIVRQNSYEKQTGETVYETEVVVNKMGVTFVQ